MRDNWLLPTALQGRRLLRFALATFVAHALSLLFIRYGGPLAPAWPPVGIALAALLTLPRDHRHLVVLGYVAIDATSNALQGYTTAPAFLYLVVVLGEMLLADVILRRYTEVPLRLARVREVFLLFASTALAAGLGSLPAALIAVKFSGAPFGGAMAVWWVGEMIAFMIVTPLTLLLLDPPEPHVVGRGRVQWVTETVVIAAAMLAVSVFGYLERTIVGNVVARPYMLMIPAIWATLRFGQLGALLATLEAAVVGVVMLVVNVELGLGMTTIEHPLMALQVFIIVLAMMSLVLATALREQHATALQNARMVEALQASEQRLRQSQKMEAIGQLAGGVAHDFNNVLSAVLMQLEELRLVRDMPRAGHELIMDVEHSVQRAARLTRQLLVFSRQQAMQLQVLDLNTLVRSHVRLLRRVVPSTYLLTEACQSGALVVHVDGGMIEQVLLNLVLNARDAQPGGGSIAIATAERELTTGEGDLPAGHYAVLTVRDNGAGIPPEHLPRLFEPFFTTKGPGEGTGLGLATAYVIVQQHRGTVRVMSHVGYGTSMEVWIPLSDATLPPTAPVEAEGTDDDPARDVNATTILVVEDEEQVRRLLQRVLERAGYVVRTAASGREALEWWPGGGGEVDLVITDLVMPGNLSGTALARELRQSRPGLPIVFTSGYDPEYNPADVTMVAGDNFIPKPATAEQILSVVRRQLLARVS